MSLSFASGVSFLLCLVFWATLYWHFCGVASELNIDGSEEKLCSNSARRKEFQQKIANTNMIGIWTNTIIDLDKYNQQFGQIHFGYWLIWGEEKVCSNSGRRKEFEQAIALSGQKQTNCTGLHFIQIALLRMIWYYLETWYFEGDYCYLEKQYFETPFWLFRNTIFWKVKSNILKQNYCYLERQYFEAQVLLFRKTIFQTQLLLFRKTIFWNTFIVI